MNFLEMMNKGPQAPNNQVTTSSAPAVKPEPEEEKPVELTIEYLQTLKGFGKNLASQVELTQKNAKKFTGKDISVEEAIKFADLWPKFVEAQLGGRSNVMLSDLTEKIIIGNAREIKELMRFSGKNAMKVLVYVNQSNRLVISTQQMFNNGRQEDAMTFEANPNETFKSELFKKYNG